MKVKYNKASEHDAIRVASILSLKSDRPAFIFANYNGYHIEWSDTVKFQSVIKVTGKHVEQLSANTREVIQSANIL